MDGPENRIVGILQNLPPIQISAIRNNEVSVHGLAD